MGEEVKALFDGCSKVCHIAPSTASEPAVQTVPQLSNIVLSGRMELARRDQVYGQQVQHADTVTDLHTHTPVRIPSQMGTDVKVRVSAQIECTHTTNAMTPVHSHSHQN